MYRSSLFAEDRPEVLHDLIHRHPLATVVTADASGPPASHVPMILHPDLGPGGVLRCHFARGKPARVPLRYWLFSRVRIITLLPPDPTKQEHGNKPISWVKLQSGGHALSIAMTARRSSPDAPN
ncbi:MAG TPA: FMN-binding negative transcriptional regulator [Bryobacteraceae bacterium]